LISTASPANHSGVSSGYSSRCRHQRQERLESKKHFWAFVVWNFDTKQVEILEITQTTVQTAMEELINSEEWGDPLGYSITVNRKGENLETEYSVVTSSTYARRHSRSLQGKIYKSRSSLFG
jgi:hypothetical protein